MDAGVAVDQHRVVGRVVHHLSQGYHARLANNLNDGATSESQALNFTRLFNGGGPLLDFGANWKVGRSNLAVYSNARGALLVGTTTQNADYRQRVIDPNGRSNGGFLPVNTLITPSLTNASDRVAPMLELELGLEYGRVLGRSRVFVRTGVVNHKFFGVGNASRTDSNLSLFGVQVCTGVDF